MRDPGVFTVVYSHAPPQPWPSVDDDIGTSTARRGETETPRLPYINKKPPLPRDIRVIRGGGLERRSSSQTDLRKMVTRLPEPGGLSTGLSRSCNSVNKTATSKPATPSNSPATLRRGLPPGGGLDREATHLNTELHRASPSDLSIDVNSPTTARKRVDTGLTRGQDTSRTIHKSSSMPHSLGSKDSKLSSNSSYTTMASSRPRKATSQNSRKLSIVSGSPSSQRRQGMLKHATSTGSLTSRSHTQLTVKTLKNSTARLSHKNQEQKKEVQTNDNVDCAANLSYYSDEMNSDGYPVRIPDGMAKETFDICWNWVASVEAARTDRQCFDMVMSSMNEWNDTESTTPNSETVKRHSLQETN